MKTLKQHLTEAADKHMAVGHFNISNIEGMWAVVNIARKMNLPVVIGVSENERQFIGLRQVVALIKSVREEFSHPIFLNADHTYTFQGVKDAVDAGFDAVIFDGAKLPIDENIEITKQCVEYAKSVNPDILVEGELGYIGQSSKVMDSLPPDISVSPDALVNPEMAAKFVEETHVDLFAPAVGNFHGMLKHSGIETIDAERVKAIKEATPGALLVLHGASGITELDLRRAIAAGMSLIHISTELRVAYRDTLKESLTVHPDEIAPYRLMENVVFEMEKVVEIKLKAFNKTT